jgi:hypothetical protein
MPQDKGWSLFDWRVATFDQKPLAKLGTEVHGTPLLDDIEKVFALIPRRKETEWVSNLDSTQEERESPRIIANFGIKYFGFGQLSRLISDQRVVSPVWSQDAGALLMVMRIAAEMCGIAEFRTPILEVGYVPLKRADTDTALILTNFGWHFSREEGAPAGENFWARVEDPKYPLREETLDLLHRAISEYGKVIDEEERRG